LTNSKQKSSTRLVPHLDTMQTIASTHSILYRSFPLNTQSIDENKQLRTGGSNILQWGPPGSTPDAILQLLYTTAARLLSPQLPDGCSAAVGDLLVQLVKSLGSCPPELITAAARKLASGPSPRVAAGLVPFFARLALADARQLLDLLASTTVEAKPVAAGSAAAAGQQVSALAAALPVLLDAAPDVEGALATRQTAAALGALLAQAGHPALAGLAVRGPPVAAAGRVTRSAAREQGGLQYTQVGFHRFLLVLHLAR